MINRIALILGVGFSVILAMVIIIPVILTWWPMCGIIWIIKGDSFEAGDYAFAPLQWTIDFPYKVLNIKD